MLTRSAAKESLLLGKKISIGGRTQYITYMYDVYRIVFA